MGARTDATLAFVALAVFVSLVALVDASLSGFFLLVGGLGTLAFELLAAREYALVRRYWDRRDVQFASLAVAIGIAAVGALLVPEPVLSLCCGATITYLAFLGLVRAGVVSPPRTWW